MLKLKNLLRSFVLFMYAVYYRRSLIFEMAKRDIVTQYVSSFLGFFWVFINPMFMVSILWFVFSVGLRVSPQGDVPFVVYLTAGIAIWNTFSEVINLSTDVVVSNPHLVKRVVFHLSILPLVKLVSSFVTHSIFLIMLMLLILLHGMPFSVCWFQALYYFVAMSTLSVGLSWVFSSVNVFARDTGQIVKIILQFGFWGTPIFWDISIMPEKVQTIIRLNPMYYIVQGYRDSFIYFVPFWKHPLMTLYFWTVAIFIFAGGALVFRRLRPHFADLL
ncbi:MAG: ABC transporter permease [Candidatus Scalindua sp.]|nr:ABC transporter permease [Candidatus Scalindua sp.]